MDQIKIFGASWCPDCIDLKKRLGRHRVAYQWIDIDRDQAARDHVAKLGNGKYAIPVVALPDGSELVEPDGDTVLQRLGVGDGAASFYDVIIIGGGPAGLTTAIYTAREGLDTLIIEQAGVGGQAAITQVLDNFPGFEEGIQGAEFAARLHRQAERFGTEVVQGEEVMDIARDGQYLTVTSVNKREYVARAVVIATGSHYRTLGVPGEQQLIGMQVHFCATCDGPMYAGKKVLVIGGGNSGFEEGLHLTKFATEVTIVEYMPEAKASAVLQDKVAEKPEMRVVLNHAVQRFEVDGTELTGVVVEDRATGKTEVWHPDGVFVFIGLAPNTTALPDTIELDHNGFVKTKVNLETSLPGVFAAGDVRSGSTKQAVAAAGEGTTAALMLRQYLQSIGEAREGHAIEQEAAAAG